MVWNPRSPSLGSRVQGSGPADRGPQAELPKAPAAGLLPQLTVCSQPRSLLSLVCHSLIHPPQERLLSSYIRQGCRDRLRASGSAWPGGRTGRCLGDTGDTAEAPRRSRKIPERWKADLEVGGGRQEGRAACANLGPWESQAAGLESGCGRGRRVREQPGPCFAGELRLHMRGVGNLEKV